MNIPTLFLILTNQIAQITVLFSPSYTGESCASNIVQQINQAKESIYISTYQFTSSNICTAVTDAHARKVKVEMIIDRSVMGTKNQQLTRCLNKKIKVWLDKKHNIMHNKIMIIDTNIVITGSYNFTNNAEKNNAENLTIIKSAEIAKQYMDNWKIHKKHSILFVLKPETNSLTLK